MPFQNNVLAGASAQGGYQITNSLRFRASNSAYIRRTIGASSTSTTVATWSFWIKRGAFAAARQVIVYNGNTAGTGNTIQLEFTSGSAILAYFNGAGTTGFTTNAVFRDPSAWYHVVLAYDSTQATDSNRAKLYVNGTQITSFSSVTYPALNQAFNAGSGDYQQMMGFGATLNTDGYMANVYFIDGQALTPSSFGQTDATTGVWVPKSYSGTYGTNGFFLQFKDATSTTTIGYDTSGNSNNFTTSGISVTSGVTFDQSLDTPTSGYASGSQIFAPSSNSVPDFRAANTEWGQAASNKNCSSAAQFEMRSGKWYWEVTVGTIGGNVTFGVSRSDLNSTFRGTGTVYYRQDGQRVIDGVNSAYGASYVANDVLGFAYDADAGTIVFYKNNSSQGTITIASGSSFGWFPACALDNAGAGVTAFHAFNFGARPFAYTPPTGFKALNTANLSVPVIKKPSTLMDIASYTGNGSTQSISSLTFQPDLVWIKSRSAATTTNIFDSQRGVQKGIQSTGPNAEYTDANTLTAFNSTGFSLGSDASSRGVNINTNTYAAWNWKESNSAGLDIVLYTGNGGGARNIAHGLGVAPKWMFVRGRDARVWAGWHTNLTSAAYYMDLGTAAAEAVDTTMFDSTAPDASNFRVGSYNNVNAVNYVTYLWSEVSGFSRFGSYVGNASTDGPFVWCGFSPKWIVIKARSIATSWMIFNPTGTSPNEAILRVLTDTAGAETSNTYGIDYLSNGFKVRAPSGYSINNSGETYTFAAFAEAPFKYARAR